MKISPLAQGTGVPSNASITQSGSDRILRAKAIMAGEDPNKVTEVNAGTAAVQSADHPLKTITMKTQQSTNRHELVSPAEANSEVQPGVETKVENPIIDGSEAPKVEATKPLSPQFAALAKQKRALQLERAKLEQEKAELASKSQVNPEEFLSKADLKANPLKIFDGTGISYDDLTQAILNNPQGANGEIKALEAQIKALKEEFSTQLAERDTQAEQQVLKELRREADLLTSHGDEFEAIRQARAQSKVVELIHKTWKQTGEILDVTEAAKLIEEQLIEDALPFAQMKKVQTKLTPQEAALVQAAEATKPQTQASTKVMRTLTNRDATTPGLIDRRSRAIAAFNGTLKR